MLFIIKIFLNYKISNNYSERKDVYNTLENNTLKKFKITILTNINK